MAKSAKLTAEIKSQFRKAVLAMLEVESKLGKLENEIEKFESLRPQDIVPANHGYSVEGQDDGLFVFRRSDLILAGIDITKWQKA